MAVSDWEKVKRIFNDCLEAPEDRRQQLLDDLCTGDATLRENVAALLQGYSQGFLEEPPTALDTGTFPRRSEIPERIDHYRILECLGEGGMGVVYLAEQQEPVRRRVALKLIKLGMDTKEIVARFESERQALAMMSHPGIAKVFDAGHTDSGRPYFVMEYAPGVPLTTHCDRHGLILRERLDLFRAVCAAVQHAHQKGIIHRDIKPSNILVTFEDKKAVPRLIDFGVAKATNQRLCEHTVYTEQGRIIGTPEYMSPEQADLTGQDIDTRTDIYSLGVVLYELVAGVFPFDWAVLRKKGYTEIARFLSSADPPRPSSRLSSVREIHEISRNRRTGAQDLLRELRRDLDWITLKAMERDRTRRYPSVSELEGDVGRYLEDKAVLARPSTIRYHTRKFVRKHRIGVVSTLALVIAALLVWVGLGIVRTREIQRLVAEAVAAVEDGDLVTGRAKALVLEERDPVAFRDAGIKERLQNLEQALAEAKSKDLRVKALEILENYRRMISLHVQWLAQHDEEPGWRPVWERQAERATWRAFLGLLDEAGAPIDQYINRATLLLYQALDAAPLNSQERELVRTALTAVSEARRSKGGIALDESRRTGFLKRVAERRELTETDPSGEQARTLHFTTSPAGSAVYCFRYEEVEVCLVPVPFRAATRSAMPVEFLEVEKNWEKRAPFEDRDRIGRVNGHGVRSLPDLAASLHEVGEDQSVQVTLLREGKEKTVEWTPFPEPKPFPPGRVVDPYAQFGLTFTAYPLDCTLENFLGTTKRDVPLQVRLPRGSYLLLFRKDGYADTRFPLCVPGRTDPFVVHLVQEDHVPPGFLYIPEGVVRTGGYAPVFQSMDAGVRPVKAFFIGAVEITLAEWLEFLNAPEVFERTNDDGEALPASPEVREELRALGRDRIALLNHESSLWTRNHEKKEWSCAIKSLRKPAIDICHFAAREYAHWRTERETIDGSRWLYRLPSDLEWERASRGVDRRIFVWGDYRVWSYCLSHPGSWHGQLLDVGVMPYDESVFGVRDMAGSQHEHTLGQPLRNWAGRSYRGGSWKEIDEQYFHIASRNTIYPTEYKVHFGLRLVAERAP